MSVTKFKIASCGLKNSTIVVLLRLKSIFDGSDLVQADVNAGGAISFIVHRVSDGLEITAETAIPATAIEDVVKNDPRWGIVDNDETIQGFNFEHLVDETNFPEGPELYEIGYKFTLNAGNIFNFRARHQTDSLLP